MSSNSSEFDVELLEQRLMNLKDTQDGIQQMSSWCLQQRAHHKKIVSSWLNVLKQVRVEHRLTLFYLANDVIQYSKRKNYEFVESWGTTLQKATTMVRDEKVRHKIFRIFKIWEQREIYTEDFLADLNGLLSVNPVKKQQTQNNADSSDEFQNSALISNIRDCVRLSLNTDKNFKNLPKVPVCDIETIKHTLKDRSHSEDVEREIDEFVSSLEHFIKSLKSEIKSRKSLIYNIEQASTFYTNQRGEVKVVVNAYKNFGNRIKVVKKKLDELTPKLPSPIPSPDINAPSPEQDADIVLPDENSFTTNMFKSQTNGYSSYMDGNLPFDINDFKRESPKSSYDSGTQAIEVISSRSEDKSNIFEHTDFYKPIMDRSSYNPTNMPLPVPPVSTYSISQTSGSSYDSESVNYGSDPYDPVAAVYTSDSSYVDNPRSSNYDNLSNVSNMPLMPPPPMPPLLGGQNDEFNSTWDMDMTWTSMDSSSSFNHSMDTPISPPHFEREGVNSNVVEYAENVNEDLVPMQDIDHRQLHIPPAVCMKSSSKEKSRFGDVDHRNLISLTGSPGGANSKSMEGSRKSENNRKNSFSSKTSDKDFRKTNVSSSYMATADNKMQPPSIDQDYRRSGDAEYRNQNLLEIPKEKTSTEASQNTTNLSSSNNTGAPLLQPPPLPPNLDLPNLAKFKDFLSPPPSMVDTSMPPPNFTKGDINSQGKTKISPNKGKISGLNKGNNANDNVESIDMEMSDDDFEDFTEYDKEEISQEMNPEDATATEIFSETDDYNDNDLPDNNESPIPTTPEPNFKVPLLKTPEYSDNRPQAWDNTIRPHNNLPNNIPNAWNTNINNNLSSSPWKNRMPIPGMINQRMVGPGMASLSGIPLQHNAGGQAGGGGGGGGGGLPGNQTFPPRGPIFSHQRNFSPQMRHNFRGSHFRPRGGSPYFNNRGRGGMSRGGGGQSRGNFRGR